MPLALNCLQSFWQNIEKELQSFGPSPNYEIPGLCSPGGEDCDETFYIDL